MYVPAEPPLDFRLLWGPASGTFDNLIAPWPSRRVVPFASCNAALWGALQALGLKSGDGLLAPSFLFHTVLNPARSLGVECEFYDVDASLSPDPSDVSARIDVRTKAVVVVHYFGFPGPVGAIRNVCNERGVALIEDCAHALFGRVGEQPLGSWGDASIFSLKKPLPIPGGGALVLNRPDVDVESSLAEPPRRETLRLLLRRAMNLVETSIGWSPRMSLLSSHAFRRRLSNRRKTGVTDYARGLSAASRQMALRVDPNTVVESRRANYEFLKSSLSDLPGLRPVFERLPPGISPFCFPFYIANRDDVQDFLLRRGVHARVYWDRAELPPDAPRGSPVLRQILDEILVLPSHQGLSSAHLTRIVRAMGDWSKKNARGTVWQVRPLVDERSNVSQTENLKEFS